MSAKDDKIIELLLELTAKTVDVEANTQIQAAKIGQIDEKLHDIKDEQIRQNKIVVDHERRSTASESRLGVIEDQHNIFKSEHAEFKSRIKVAEKPGLVLKNIWKALITLGAGAASMYAILRLLDFIK